MERGTRTTIDNLAIGDRFYKVKDGNRIVHEKVEHAPLKTKYCLYRNWARADNEKHAQAMKSGTEVVFLRSRDEQR